MASKLNEDRVTLAELQSKPLAAVKQARRRGRAVVVTSNGRPDVVIVSAALYQRRLKQANLAALIAESEADVAAGRLRSAREFFAQWRHGKEVSR